MRQQEHIRSRLHFRLTIRSGSTRGAHSVSPREFPLPTVPSDGGVPIVTYS
jgi:hypothetical protein